jgi:hypothetical protein
MFHLPRPNSVLRLLTIFYGILIFIWMSFEDNQTWPVVVLGSGLATLLVIWLLLRQMGGTAIRVRSLMAGGALLGALVGLGACLAATFLMFFKNAWHAHVFLDYPAPMLLAMLSRAPYWTAAGGLGGLGLSLLRVVFQERNR